MRQLKHPQCQAFTRQGCGPNDPSGEYQSSLGQRKQEPTEFQRWRGHTHKKTIFAITNLATVELHAVLLRSRILFTTYYT